MNDKPIAAGKSSFNLVDTKKLFSELRPKINNRFLDIACGNGEYSLAVSKDIGQTGRIFAFDLWKDGIESLAREIRIRNISNIDARVVDVSKQLPIEDRSIDICLMATVLHDLIEDKTDDGTLREIKRVMKHRGTIAIIEFKKIKGPPGPPVEIRVSPEEVEKRLTTYGFRIIKTTDVGTYNYLSIFTL